MADIMRERKAIHSPRQVNLGEDHTYAGIRGEEGQWPLPLPEPIAAQLRTLEDIERKQSVPRDKK